MRRVRRFARHAKVDTVAIYDDARQDFGEKLAELLCVDGPDAVNIPTENGRPSNR